MKRISKRKAALWIFLIGNLVPICYVCWMCFVPPAPLEISAETTLLTTPLTADGQHVDYLRHTKEQIGEHNYREDLWKALVSPDRPDDESTEWALSQIPEVKYTDPRHTIHPELSPAKANHRTRERHTARRHMPYSDETDPIYAVTTRENEDWYLAVLQTEPGPIGVYWYDDSLADGFLRPISDVHVDLAERFALRASLAFGEHRFGDAVQTMKFIDTVARRERTLPFQINKHTADNIVLNNINTTYYGTLASEEIPLEILREFDAYGSEQTDWKSWVEGLEQDRLTLLQTLSEAHRTRGQSDDFDMFYGEFGPKCGNWFVKRIDFDSAMRLTNDTWDKAISAFQIRDTQQSLAALNKLVADVTKRWPEPSPSEPEPTLSELVTGDHNGYAHHYAADTWWYEHLRKNVAYSQNSRKRLRLAVRLHAFRQRFGNWPESLDELGQLPDWNTPAVLLEDSYTGKPVRYRRTDDGFLLWSVGPNCIDECHGEVPEDWPKDFESDGDDELWPWPDPRVQWSEENQGQE